MTTMKSPLSAAGGGAGFDGTVSWKSLSYHSNGHPGSETPRGGKLAHGRISSRSERRDLRRNDSMNR